MKKAKTITKSVPEYWLVGVDDYHHFDYILEKYKIILPTVKYEEAGYDTEYVAVFWIGRKPTEYINNIKAEIEKKQS